MKIILITFAIIAVATPAPIEKGTERVGDVVQIVRSLQVFEADGSYKFSFETADGYIHEETGSIVNPGKENAYVARVGLYRFKDSMGETVEVHYTADTKSFVPRGTHIPTVPDVPVAAIPEVVDPTISDVVMPIVPDVAVPVIPEVVEPTVSDVVMPIVPDVGVPVIPEVVEPTVSDVVMSIVPDVAVEAIPDVVEPTVSDLSTVADA